MKKSLWRGLFGFIVFLFLLLLLPVLAAAGSKSIDKIEIDAYVDSSGTAFITEVWTANLTEGTEGYRPYVLSGTAAVSDFSVTDDTGAEYTFLENWNVEASFQQKTHKCGFHSTFDGVELCWGISEYGKRTYTLQYKVSGFVEQYSDTQGIYWNFLNLDQSVGQVKITIHAVMPLSLDNARIWAFGNDGTIVFAEDGIVLDSGGYLSSNQYMVALVRFESNLFTTDNVFNKSFDDVYEEAFSTVDSSDGGTSASKIQATLLFFLTVIRNIFFNPGTVSMGIMIAVIIIVSRRRTYSSPRISTSKKVKKEDFGPEGKKLPPLSSIDYWRDIPCDGDLVKAYWIARTYTNLSKKKMMSGIIGALILKWIKEGRVTVKESTKGLFRSKKKYAISMNTFYILEHPAEEKLGQMMTKAAGKNGILEAKEFSKWSRSNYEKVSNWFDFLEGTGRKLLKEDGLITVNRWKDEAPRRKTVEHEDITYSPALREEAIRLMGLKKYLQDFSRMPEKEYPDVHLWEKYLMFAQLLGIADKVQKQFQELYPDFEVSIPGDFLLMSEIAMDFGDIGYHGMNSGKRAATSGSSYGGSDTSSGGGGSSYSSGGSSSSGSSGGGFR